MSVHRQESLILSGRPGLTPHRVNKDESRFRNHPIGLGRGLSPSPATSVPLPGDVVVVRELQVLLDVVHVPVVCARIRVNIAEGSGRELGRRAGRGTGKYDGAGWSRVGASRRRTPSIRVKPVDALVESPGGRAAAEWAMVSVPVGVARKDKSDLTETPEASLLAQIGGL